MEPKQRKQDEPVKDAAYWNERRAEHEREKARWQAMIDVIIRSGATCRQDEDTQPYAYRSADDE